MITNTNQNARQRPLLIRHIVDLFGRDEMQEVEIQRSTDGEYFLFLGLIALALFILCSL